jgi:hypothetical protein
MRASIMFLSLIACNVPVDCLETVGQSRQNDAGETTCSTITAPGDCRYADKLIREYEAYLPVGHCISYSCDCETHWFCKNPPLESPASPGFLFYRAWTCTATEAWCSND